MNIKSLKEDNKKKLEEIDKLRKSIVNNPIVIKAQEAYQKALADVEKELFIHPKITKLYAEISQNYKEIGRLQEEERNSAPQEIQEFIRKLSNGVDWGYYGMKVKWFSPDKRFVIVTNPGHTYASGMTRNYGQTSHYLFDTSKVKDGDDGYTLSKTCMIFKCEGRLNKTLMENWKDFATKESK